MAVLPESNIDLSSGVVFEDQPSLTWYVDPTSKQISGKADGLNAVRQAVEIILCVERFRWQIYGPYFGMQWNGLIGNDAGYVSAELQRRILDAFSTDNRILGLEQFSYSVSGNTLVVSMLVTTVFGSFQQTVEVMLD